MGDLLPWWKNPQHADMLKAYIIKSRVRQADKLLLVQAYCPHLFRQGNLPGPKLLLDVLLGTITAADAKNTWKKLEKAKGDDKGKPGAWMLEQTLPCRRCTDKHPEGKEVWKPVKSFDTHCRTKDIWTDSISSGQDALCFDCRKELGDASTTDLICCEGCGHVKPKDKFDFEDRRRWQSLHLHSVLCISCTEASHTRKDAKMVQCNGELCNHDGNGTKLPEYHFMESC